MIFPFLAGLFGGLGAAGAAGAAGTAAAAPLATGAAAGLGAAGAAGAGAAGAGAAGAAGALPALAAAGALPGAAGAGAAGLTAAELAAAGTGAAGAGAGAGGIGAALPAAIPAAAPASAIETAAALGSSVGSSVPSLPAAAAPVGEVAKIGARLPSMIPPSTTPVPLPAASVPTQSLTQGATFAGTATPETLSTAGGLTPPQVSPMQLFGPTPAEASMPLTGPTGPNIGTTTLSPTQTFPSTTPGVDARVMDLVRSTEFPAGPLPTAPTPPGSMPPGRLDVAFDPFMGPSGPMPADASITMAQVTPDAGGIGAAAPQGPINPIDIPGSATQPAPQQIAQIDPVTPVEPLSEPSISAPGEDTVAFTDSGAGITAPEPLDTAPVETAAAEEGDGGMFGGYGKFILPAAAAASAFLPTSDVEREDDDGEGPEESEAADYDAQFPGEGYRPGVDPEFRYFRPRFADGGMINVPFDVEIGEPSVQMGDTIGGIGGALPTTPTAPETPVPPSTMPGTLMPQQTFQEGGPVEDPRMNVVMDAAAAMRGEHPEPQQAIDAFVEMFGEPALQQLQEAMASEPRMVQGPGGPKDDMIPAVINDVQEARLSDGEFVMPADAVAAMGGGDATLGAQQMQMLSEQLRGQQPTGQLNVDRVAAT